MKCLKEYYIERWLMANMYGKEVIVREMQAEIDRLMKICKKIEEHPKCNTLSVDVLELPDYEKVYPYGKEYGIMLGHLGCAAIARKAREK
jgi:hypothetical protein